MKLHKSQTLILIAFIFIYVIWGSTYLFNKIIVTELAPFFIGAIRFITAGILIMIIAKLLKLKLHITKKQFLNCFIAGFLFLVYGNGVFVWALKFVDSGFAALLASTQPLFVLLLMRLVDRKPMQKKSIFGVSLGLLGMYLLVSQHDITSSEGSIIGIFYDFHLCTELELRQCICFKSGFTTKFFCKYWIPNVNCWNDVAFRKFNF